MYKLGYLYSDNRYNRRLVAYTDFLIPTPPIIGNYTDKIYSPKKDTETFSSVYRLSPDIYYLVMFNIEDLKISRINRALN